MTLTSLCGMGAPSGGFGKLEYLPLAWLDATTYEWMVNTSGEMVGSIAPAGSYTWLEAALKPFDRTHTDAVAPDAQGGAHTRTVSGSIAVPYAEAAPLIGELRTHRYLLRLTDKAGSVIYLNSAACPAVFSGGFDGGTLQGKPVTNITFTIESGGPAAPAV